MTTMSTTIAKEFERLSSESVSLEDAYDKAATLIRNFSKTHLHKPESTIGFTRNALAASIEKNVVTKPDEIAAFREVLVRLDAVAERNHIVLTPPNNDLPIPISELIRYAMSTTRARRALLDSWVELLGGNEEFDQYMETFLRPKIIGLQTGFDGIPESYTYRDFGGIYFSFLGHAMSETYRVIQKQQPDPDGIKPILVLFALTAPLSASGLSKWITRGHAPYFTRIASLLRDGIGAEHIEKAIEHNLDSSIMRSIIDN